MKTAVVLGRGFGLYGHAAALGQMGWRVLLPLDYRAAVASRVELAGVADRFEWFDEADTDAALAASRLLCLARRPADNLQCLRRLDSGEPPALLVVEKPLARDAAESLQWLRTLAARGRRFSTPYLLLYTAWYAELARAIESGRGCEIDWAHRRAPALATWKSDAGAGGGALGFYVIHLFAVFRALGLAVEAIERRGEQWVLHAGGLRAVFRLAERPGFHVTAAGECVFTADGPFGATPRAGEPDPRVEPLCAFYRAVEDSAGMTHDMEFHRQVFGDWLRAEGIPQHVEDLR